MNSPFTLALSLATDALVVWLLLLRPRTAVTLPHLLRAFAVGLLWVMLKAVPAILVTGRPFLAIHLLHSWLFLLLPCAGAALACGVHRAGITPAARAGCIAGAVLLAALGGYSSFVEPYDLRTETATVDLAPERAGRTDLRIAVLSDLQCDHVGDHERQAVARVMAGHPDLILLPGDLTQIEGDDDYAALMPQMHALLAALDAPLGVYFVLGDCDWSHRVDELLQGTPVQLLLDQVVEREWHDRRVTIAGVDLRFELPGIRAVFDRLAQPGDDVRILCAHRPDVALVLPGSARVDLIVSGHTHGGQVQLPLIGPLITLSRVPRDVAAGGLHVLRGTQIWVSRGAGVEGLDAPRVRFNCPPEVSQLTLRTLAGGQSRP